MSRASLQQRVFASLAFVLAGLTCWTPSAEASLNDFISVYQKIESAAPAGTLPVSSQDIVAYEDLFTCAEGGGDVVVCTKQFHDTHPKQEPNIPETVWQGIDAYVAWKDGDTWGVVENLGAAAACAVLQVLAGGSDICGLLQDLYDAAMEAYDTAKWVVKFFKSLGEGAWNAVKAVGCAFGLGGCDDDPPPPPPEISAYNQFFAPKIKDGSALKERESKDQNAFGTLVNQLSSAAKQKFSFTAVLKASEGFTEQVNKLWNSDIANKVLPALAAKRDVYNNTQKAQNVAAAVKDAATAYAASKVDPRQRAIKHCFDDFSEFVHFDYWSAEFKVLWAQLGSSPTNAGWCSQIFWYKNKDAFVKSFRDFVAANLCPALGQQLYCSAVAKYESCLALMGSVDQKNQCSVAVAQVGYEAAVQVNKVLHEDTGGIKKSTIPCQIVADKTPLSVKPAQLVCPRPVQQYYCNETYKTLFPSLPVKLLDCTPGAPDPGYTSLVSKVQTAVSTTIPKTHPKFPAGALMKDQIDPLIVHAAKLDWFTELQKANQNFGFGPPSAKAGFDYVAALFPPRTKDGVNTPVLIYDQKIQLPVEKVKLGQVMQPDPAIRKPGELTTKSPGDKLTQAKAPVVGAPSGGGGFAPKTAGGFAPKSGAGDVAVAPGAIGGAGQSLPKPAMPLSGDAPAGISKGQLAVIGAQAKIEANCQAPQAALTVSVKIKNAGGLPAGGGSTIRVKEIGGATNLSSAVIPLPVVKPGETRDLSIPVATTSPYASLPGMHQLGVYLEPQLEKPLAPYQLSANVPAGHCASRVTSPAPAKTPPTRQ